MNTINEQNVAPIQVITPEVLLSHWQGHRALTRRVIEAFPEDQFFTFSIGGMRTFGEMAMELLSIAGPGIQGFVTGTWSDFSEGEGESQSKASILKHWDETTAIINALWSKLTVAKFSEPIKAFNQYEGTVLSSLFYFIDNEIHHRGQGYVYLRALGIQPPAFWER